jgi:hypothetical protein
MRVRGRAAAGVLAAGMALTLVAAESAPATPPQGTASTSMFGADIQITNLPEVGDLGVRLMELTSFATTVDAPFAQSSVIPLTLPDGSTPGAIEARSDGDTSGSSELASLGDLEGLLGASVNPISTTAYAGTTSAVASIQAAVAELAALTEAIGVDITTPAITSIVGNNGAVATQGVTVSDLGLNLAALGLVSDILEQLGVDQVLALLNGFGFESTDIDELNTVLDQLQGIQAAIDEEVAILQGLLDNIAGLLAEYEELNDLLASLGSLTLTELLALAETLDCELDLLSLTLLDDALTCVTGALQDAIADILGLLEADLTDVLASINTLTGLVADYDEALGGLEGLLDAILALLDDLANAPLLGVTAFDIGVNATATDSVDTSSATVLCDELTVTVLTEDFTTPSCADGLSLVGDVAAQVTGAVSGVADLLESALPIEGLGDLKFDVFANLVRDVSEADGVVTATAGLDLLDMQIPSLTLDPDLVTSGLDLDVLGLLDDLLATLDDVTETLGALDGIDAILGLIDDIEDAIEGTEVEDGLRDLIQDVNDTIAGLLENLPFGTLDVAFTTPGIALTIDPTSTASFQPGSPATPGAPDPDDGPELPVTGGGLALLGLLAISGAATMRRRRN